MSVTSIKNNTVRWLIVCIKYCTSSLAENRFYYVNRTCSVARTVKWFGNFFKTDTFKIFISSSVLQNSRQKFSYFLGAEQYRAIIYALFCDILVVWICPVEKMTSRSYSRSLRSCGSENGMHAVRWNVPQHSHLYSHIIITLLLFISTLASIAWIGLHAH